MRQPAAVATKALPFAPRNPCNIGIMLKRIVMGAVMIAFAAALLGLDGHLSLRTWPGLGAGAGWQLDRVVALPLGALVAALVVLGYLELARLVEAGGGSISRGSGIVCAVLVATSPVWRQVFTGGLLRAQLAELLISLCLIALFVEQVVRHRTDGAIRRLAGSMLAIAYLGVCGAMVLSLRTAFGMNALVLFLAAVKCTDIGAYFTGSAIGKHKIIPWLSPGKSWEGLVGGLALAVGVSVLLTWTIGPTLGAGGGAAKLSLPAAAVFGVVMGVFGQAADMCESLLKRNARIKDAGNSVPGFGGVLDVLDSPLLAAPAGYVFFLIVTCPAAGGG